MTFSIPPAAVPVVVTGILFTTIAFVVVVSRFYTRRVLLQNAGADDYIILGSVAASIAFLITVFYQIKFGLGLPFKTIPLYDLEEFFQCLWITIPMYNLSLVLTKISIIFQYMRIFTAKRVRLLCRIMVGILILYGCWTFIGSIFMCVPVAAFWDQSIQGHCMNKLAFWFANAALNITTDLMIFAIPMPLLKQLQLPRQQKIGLMFVFGLGAFVCVTSVIRLKSLYQISVSADTSLEGVNAAIWSGIEINVGIACSSLPALKPLLVRILPGLRSIVSSKDRSRSNMTSLSGEEQAIHNHQMNKLSRSSLRVVKVDEIQVEREVHQQRDSAPSQGSESDLVEWSADCYSESMGEERRAKSSHEAV